MDKAVRGKLRRLVLNDPDTSILPTSPGTWDTDSVLIDAGQPISTAPTVAMDWKKRTWVFFGTGRFASQEDVADASQQSFYGIKEPWEDTSGHENNMVDIDVDADGDGATGLENEMTWEEVSLAMRLALCAMRYCFILILSGTLSSSALALSVMMVRVS